MGRHRDRDMHSGQWDIGIGMAWHGEAAGWDAAGIGGIFRHQSLSPRVEDDRSLL